MRLLVVLVCSLTLYCTAADDLAIVVDVSGSMHTYGSWQVDAKNAVSAIIAGRPLPSGWNSTPKSADLSGFACGPQARVTLVPFGSVHPTAEYPYFDRIQDSLSLAELTDRFPIETKDYSESRTNNALAEAVAIRSVDPAKIGAARVIMLSDFLADATLSEKQLAFVNDIQGRFAKYTDVTLTWASNPRVQIKLLRFVPLNPPAERAITPNNGALHLFPGRYDERSNSLLLAWSFEGPELPEKYDLRITDGRRGTMLFSKYNLATQNATYAKAVPGPIRWAVTAYMRDGKTVEQSAAYNVPGTRGSPIALLVLVLAVLAALGTGIVIIKRHGLPDFLAVFKRRTDTDI
jgi:hypothetical protein